jgi:two-component system, OmpR family, sensor histidine kinase KdpD
MIWAMNDTTVALAFLLGVLIVAAISSRRVAIAASLVAFVCFNFFFLPPVGTFAIANRDDLIALLALLGVSLIGSHLSYQARKRAEETVVMAAQRNEAEVARRSAETKSALVASLSHDLKSPLTALTVAAGNLGTVRLSDDERGEQIEIVQTELDRLKRLFDNIVEMASVETRAVSAELQWVPPADIVDAARHQVATVLVSHDVRITDHGAGMLVNIDPRLTSAALAHVLENAASYSPAGSPIVVDVRVAHGRLVIAVRDHGPGLPPGDFERVFERFYRGSETAQARFGTGMGLAITRGLLAIQGGRITASNHAEGGAIFTLDIPVAARPADRTALDVA